AGNTRYPALILPADDGTTIRFPVNLGIRNAYGLELNVNYEVADWWASTTNLNFYQARVRGSFAEVDYNADITSWNGRLINRLDLTKKLQFQVTFDYEAPQNTPQGRDLGLYSVDLGGSLDVLSGKGTLTLSGRDIFNTRIRRSVISLPDYTSTSDFQWRRAQSIVLSFVYRLDEKN
ncbi:MAG: outer membrane beta-barrel protein, partial [Bacteroidota bacterium]